MGYQLIQFLQGKKNIGGEYKVKGGDNDSSPILLIYCTYQIKSKKILLGKM